MLKRLLEHNFSAVGIFFFVALVKTLLFFTGQVDSGDYSYSLFDLFTSHNYWSGIVAAAVTILLGVYVLINSERHSKRSDFSLLMVLIFSLLLCFEGYYGFTVEYVGLFFFISSFFVFSKSISNLHATRTVIDLFNLSFLLALGSLFTPHLIYMLPVYWLGFLVISTSNLKALVASVVGYVLPFVLIDTLIYTFFSETYQYSFQHLHEQLSLNKFSSPLKITGWEQLANVGPLILVAMSVYTTFRNTFSVKTVVRKFNLINLFILTYTLLIAIIGLMPTHLGMMILFVPTTYLFSNYHTLSRKNQQGLFLYVLILSAILSYPPVTKGIITLYEMVF